MIANADAARIPLPDKSVHCAVTSPPYFGPRKYKGEQARDWPAVSYSPMPGLPPFEVPAMRCELGREATPESYVAHLVLCFREVWRVLRDDGTCWVVEGDSYQGSGQGWGSSKSNYPGYQDRYAYERPPSYDRSGKTGLKSGNLLAIPYRLLLALQADGWLVRNDVVWSKVAPMPESVSGTKWERHQVKVAKSARANPNSSHTLSQQGANNAQGARDGVNFADHSNEYQNCPGCPRCSATGGYVLRRGSWRHTRSHETVIMLAKQMGYFSDQERVRETNTAGTVERLASGPVQAFSESKGKRLTRGDSGGEYITPAGRNPRDVLTPSPSPFKGEHYAAFPPDLIRPLILSSAPLKCCPVCGAGWAAVVDKPDMSQRPTRSNGAKTMLTKDIHVSNGWAGYPKSAGQAYQEWRNDNPDMVIGYRPTCQCAAADWQPGLVLDCFAGSGTTGLVCRELGLRFVGLDISGEYLRDIALVRSERLTPDSAMVNLPLFTLLQS